jgi:hypothetical protein
VELKKVRPAGIVSTSWVGAFIFISFIKRRRFIYKRNEYLYIKEMVKLVKKRTVIGKNDFEAGNSKLLIYSIGILLVVLVLAGLFVAYEKEITGKVVLIKPDCPSGMVSYWMLDDGAGTNAEDSFDSHNGTLMNGPAWTTGKVDGGLFFDGTNDYVQTPSNELKTANDFTISLWFKAGKTDFAHHLIWQGRTDGNGWANNSVPEMHISLGDYTSSTLVSNSLSFFLGSDSSSSTLHAAVSFSDKSQWHHVAAVVSDMSSSPKVEFYLDGVLVDSDSGSISKTSRTLWNSTLILGKPGKSKSYFNGTMDEVAIFDRSFSASDIKELYDKTRYGLDNYCSLFKGSSTINTYYNSNTNILTVSGEAPKAATRASLTISKTSSPGTPVSPTPLDSAVTLIGGNPSAYNFDVDVSSFDSASYDVKVAFFDSTDNEITGFGVSSIFNNLLLDELNANLTALEQNVSYIINYLASLNVSGGIDFSQNISFLINQTIILQGELDDLSDRVDAINASLYALTIRVDGIDSTLADLESWLTALSSRVSAMNHGTINLYYLGPGPVPILRNRLSVFGEAPAGAASAEISLYDSELTWGDLFSGNPPVTRTVVPVLTALPSNQNLYFGSIATSSLEPIKYNVVVRFYDSSSNLMTGYDVSALFDNLIILDIAERLDDVEKDIYGDARNQLMDTIRLDYCAWKVANGGNSGPAYTPYCTGSSSSRQHNWREMLQDYGYEDTLYWTMQNFYRDSSQLWDEIDSIWENLDDLFMATYYGFHDIVFTSRVETYYNTHALVPITYTLRSNVTIPLAKITIKDPFSGFWQVLRISYIGKDITYRFKDYVWFSDTGWYNMQLDLTGLFGIKAYESTNFEVRVVDLADLVPDSTIDLVLPDNWGNSFSNPPNPPNDDISWHQPGLINMRAVLGANTPAADKSCEVYYHSNRNPSLGRILLPGLPLDSNISVCAGDLLSSMMDEGDEGIYNVEVEQEFISSYDQTDYIRIGIDDTQPIIYRIIPSKGYYSGTLLVQVNATDEASGIRSVWVSLISKDTPANYSGEAMFNNATGYFEVQFDTIALGVADGTYDINANVTDNAGNFALGTVDPGIDNTPPSIVALSVPNSMCVGATNVFNVIVTDLLSGVCAKNATLTLPNSSVVNLLFAGYNLYYVPDANLSGFYDLTVTASDCAITPNNMTNVSEYNLTVEECPVPLEATGGGGGGGGGSACTTSWDCSEWSDCVNGEQSRTCAKERSTCYAGDKPAETRTCTVAPPQPEEAAPLLSPVVPEQGISIITIVLWSLVGAGAIGGIIWYIFYLRKKKRDNF